MYIALIFRYISDSCSPSNDLRREFPRKTVNLGYWDRIDWTGMQLVMVAACGTPSIAETLETHSPEELKQLAGRLSEDFEIVDIHILSSNGGPVLASALGNVPGKIVMPRASDLSRAAMI
jgi:hypothetical protein